MTELQQNRYDRLIRRVGNLIGAKSMVNDVLGELFPMIDVENVPGELLALQPTDLGWCSSELLATVAVRNHHQLFNPDDSNVLLVVTKVVAFTADISATDFRFSNFIGALTTLAGNERRRDTRAGTLAGLVAQQRTAQDVVSGGLDFRIRSTRIAELSDENGVAILFPGTGLTVTAQTLNIDSTVSFMWRERVFEESEREGSG